MFLFSLKDTNSLEWKSNLSVHKQVNYTPRIRFNNMNAICIDVQEINSGML